MIGKSLKVKVKSSAFTLIELLVVISIIGVLAALSLVSFATAQRQARDAQRKSDLRQYSTALESSANLNGGLYPSRSVAITISAGNLCTDLVITNCPVDPKTSDATYAYKYVSDGTGSGNKNATKYVLWAKLESATNYWVICSTGKSGASAISGWTDPMSGACPI
jgi:prepilin-type N-terminal cleavage/methylation domain-containing protein